MQATHHGLVVQYIRLPRLLEGLELARASGSLPELRGQLARTSLLILDDWAVVPGADNRAVLTQLGRGLLGFAELGHEHLRYGNGTTRAGACCTPRFGSRCDQASTSASFAK